MDAWRRREGGRPRQGMAAPRPLPASSAPSVFRVAAPGLWTSTLITQTAGRSSVSCSSKLIRPKEGDMGTSKLSLVGQKRRWRPGGLRPQPVGGAASRWVESEWNHRAPRCHREFPGGGKPSHVWWRVQIRKKEVFTVNYFAFLLRWNISSCASSIFMGIKCLTFWHKHFFILGIVTIPYWLQIFFHAHWLLILCFRCIEVYIFPVKSIPFFLCSFNLLLSSEHSFFIHKSNIYFFLDLFCLLVPYILLLGPCEIYFDM